MAKLRKSGIRGSSVPLLLMGVTAFGFLGLIGLGIAWASGYFDGSPGKKPVDRTGQLAFPALVRAVPAFESLTKDDFIDPRTGQLHVIWLPEATATIATRDMSELIGRVVRRDKLMNSVLSENDLLEKGTRPGLSAGVPVGKVALSMPAAGIPGLEQLRNRDRFDLMIALPQREDNDQISNSEPAALFGGVKAPSLRVGQLSRQHGVKQLVTDGM
ncbi:MAG: hypothetical protein GY875_14305, partial [Gammaproteobacteria bacterium]|nr:hypothetical protein [Gammaproteobacteria bacterium]